MSNEQIRQAKAFAEMHRRGELLTHGTYDATADALPYDRLNRALG